MILYGSTLVAVRPQGARLAGEKGIELELQAGSASTIPTRNSARPARSARCRRWSTATIALADFERDHPLSGGQISRAGADPGRPAAARAGPSGSTNLPTRSCSRCGGKMFFNRVVAPRFLSGRATRPRPRPPSATSLPPILDYLENGRAGRRRLSGRRRPDPGRHRGGQPVRQPRPSRIASSTRRGIRAPPLMSSRSWPARASRRGSNARPPSWPKTRR